jgi:hypothetical protein
MKAFVDLTKFNSPQEYFKACDTDVRTCYRKANKLNYSIIEHKEIDVITSNQLYDIWISTDVRQNRPINLNYEHSPRKTSVITRDKWPVEIYDLPDRMFCILVDSVVVGYLELRFSYKDATVHSTLGHYDYLKHGIMKALFFEVIKLTWGEIDKLIYGEKHQSNYFKRDLLIL